MRGHAQADEAHPGWGLNTRTLEAGDVASLPGGRCGRVTSSPPQLGHTRPGRRVSAQSRQKVHSKEQITASVASGGRFLPQHSQFGRNSSIAYPVYFHSIFKTSNERVPLGVVTSQESPFSLPIRARAMGEEMEIFPSLRFASRSPTI